MSQFRTNVVGVVHTINAFLPLLRKGATKKIIVISTGLGDTQTVINCDYATAVPYSVSKAAVNMVVAKYAVTLRKDGFVVVALSPGLVKTMVMSCRTISLYRPIIWFTFLCSRERGGCSI